MHSICNQGSTFITFSSTESWTAYVVSLPIKPHLPFLLTAATPLGQRGYTSMRYQSLPPLTSLSHICNRAGRARRLLCIFRRQRGALKIKIFQFSVKKKKKRWHASKLVSQLLPGNRGSERQAGPPTPFHGRGFLKLKKSSLSGAKRAARANSSSCGITRALVHFDQTDSQDSHVL